MKREVLRLNNIVKYQRGSPLLDHLNLQLFEREIMGVYCSNSPDKSCLMSLLHGEIAPDHGQVYFEEKKLEQVQMASLRGRRIYFIDAVSNLIPDLTIADNFFYIRKHSRKYFIPRHVLREQTSRILSRYGMDIDPAKYVSELNLLDRFKIELVKSQLIGCSIIIVDQMFDVLEDAAIKTLLGFIDILRANNVSVICFSGSDKLLTNMSDRITVMRDGYTCRVLEHDDFLLHPLDFYFNEAGYDRGNELLRQENEYTGEIAFKINNRGVYDRIGPFRTGKGKISCILDTERRVIAELEQVFEDPDELEAVKIDLSGRSLVIRQTLDILRGSIAYIPKKKVEKLYISDLTPVENIYLAISQKRFRFLVSSNRMNRHIWHSFVEWCMSLDLGNEHQYYLDFYQNMLIIFYKCVITSPHLIVVTSPYHALDRFGRRLIRAILDRLKQDGLTVLLISANYEEAYELADDINAI